MPNSARGIKGQRGGRTSKEGRQVDDASCDWEIKNVAQDNDGSGYAFSIQNRHAKSDARIPVKIGGVMVDILIDSGSDTNIIDRQLWENLKMKKNQMHLKEM